MLQTAFDLSKEGALFIDDKGIVRLRNDFACRILGPQKTAAGDKLTDMLPEIKHLYAQSRKAPGIIENELFSRDGKSYSASFVPVPVKGRRDGTLFIFRDIGIIQDMEAQIRRKIHAKGMVTKYSFSHIISNDPRMAAIIGRAGKFAAVDSNVLIEGETGTGKELFAQSIHNASPRSRRPFVAINCAALPEHLLESELFGYSGGAFTGASPDGKKGLFELAHNGTLFLDEVSELPVTLQVKLLRAIEEKEIRRIGDDRIFPVNVRVIAATNKNLRSLCENGGFREDLFFRLNVLSLSIPPLRERLGDILTLFHKFLGEYAAKFEKTFPAMDSTCRTLLLSHSWRGNVREVRNIAERVMALYEQTDQDPSGIIRSIISEDCTENRPRRLKNDPAKEKQLIKEILAVYPRKAAAARVLGMSRSTLWRKLKEYRIVYNNFSK